MGRYKDYDREQKRREYGEEEQPNSPDSEVPAPRRVTSAAGGQSLASQVVGQVTQSIGTVTLYKADKGFGFAKQDDGGKDVFIHVTALSRAGLSGLVEGQRVRMQIGQGKKGLEAQSIELVQEEGPGKTR
jgi:CspA family cold shock protein